MIIESNDQSQWRNVQIQLMLWRFVGQFELGEDGEVKVRVKTEPITM